MVSLAFLSLLLLLLAWPTLHYWLQSGEPEDIQHDKCPLLPLFYKLQLLMQMCHFNQHPVYNRGQFIPIKSKYSLKECSLSLARTTCNHRSLMAVQKSRLDVHVFKGIVQFSSFILQIVSIFTFCIIGSTYFPQVNKVKVKLVRSRFSITTHYV